MATLALACLLGAGCTSRLGSGGHAEVADTNEGHEGGEVGASDDGLTATSGHDDGDGDLDGGGDPDEGDDEGDPDADGSCDFIDCASDLPPSLDLCNFWARNCPEGEKCTPAMSTPGSGAWDVYVCAPIVDDPNTLGEPCERVESGPLGMDTCDAESLCLDVDPATGLGACVGYCLPPGTNPSCADPWASCRVPAASTLTVCRPACNPLLTGECPGDQICIAAYEQETLVKFVCFPPAAHGTGGEECSCANCCAAQHMCAPADDYGPGCAFDLCCTEYCDVSDPDFTCAGPDQQCVALFESAPPGFDLVGVCRVPG